MSGKGTISALLKAIRAKCGDQEAISCTDLLTMTADDSNPNFLDKRARVALRLVLTFLTDEELISLETLDEVFGRQDSELNATLLTDTKEVEAATVNDAGDTGDRLEVASIDAQITISARISDQKLRIEFAVGGEDSTLNEPST